MQEIKCPKCGELFQIDEAGYAQIVKQVRDREFANELEKREQALEAKKDSDLKVAVLEKENVIKELQAKIENAETLKKLAINEAVQKKDAEEQNVKEQYEQQLRKQHDEFTEKISDIDKKHAQEIKIIEGELQKYKEYKLQSSTKGLGEGLEQYCLNEFNKIRMTAFPNAYFEKDNDVVEGTKGDFVFKEADGNGVEFLSIMFEMKNEADETATKHKNEDFFKKLDSDRNKKNCEYAVLVSMLESDNELYNQGIVDVSYRYPKMFVIRPQFFLPIIGLLRNMALNTLKYKQELVAVQNQQVDLHNFENALLTAKNDFSSNYTRAAADFEKAIDEIDKSIAHLQKTREELVKSGNQLRIANNKLMDVTVKKLTKDAPSIRAEIEGKE